MFDIGFFELLIIAVVGLLVIGPEELPGAIRFVSLWIGRLRNSFNEIKTEIEREVGADDIKRQLHNEAILQKLKKTAQQTENSIQDIHEDLKNLAEPDKHSHQANHKPQKADD